MTLLNKRLLLIIFFSFVTSCVVHRKHEYEMVGHIDAQKDGNRYIDSLKSAKIDTIIGYFYWTSLGPCPYYIYWQKKGQGYITQITRYTKYNIIEKNLCYDAFTPLITHKLDTEKIETELITYDDGAKKIITPLDCDDCPVEDIKVFVRHDSIAYRLPMLTRDKNSWSCHVTYIDKFRSFLLEITEWKMLNPKYEKVKRRGGYQIWE